MAGSEPSNSNLSYCSDFAWWLDHASNIRDLALVPTALIGIILLCIRTWAVHKQARAAADQARLTDTNFTDEVLNKALEQLSSDNVGERVFALSKLEKTAVNDPQYLHDIVRIICNFLKNEKRPEENGPTSHPPAIEIDSRLKISKFSKDRARAIEILGRNLAKIIQDDHHIISDNWDNYVDFQFCDLSHIGMRKYNFNKCDGLQANFAFSSIRMCSFRGAWFRMADFSNAKISYCDFSNANLASANFSNAEIFDVNWENADISGAQFNNVGEDLVIALRKAKNFEKARIQRI